MMRRMRKNRPLPVHHSLPLLLEDCVSADTSLSESWLGELDYTRIDLYLYRYRIVSTTSSAQGKKTRARGTNPRSRSSGASPSKSVTRRSGSVCEMHRGRILRAERSKLNHAHINYLSFISSFRRSVLYGFQSYLLIMEGLTHSRISSCAREFELIPSRSHFNRRLIYYMCIFLRFFFTSD